MVSLGEVQAQLKRIGADFRFWGRAEAAELQHILMSGETIEHAVNGRYEGGFAMLVATDLRVLLIDKKPFYLTVEDIRYDMVAEVDYSHRLLDATIRICSVNKVFRFTSFRHRVLRQQTMYIQQRAMNWRQNGGFEQAITKTVQAATQTDPLPAQGRNTVGKVAIMGFRPHPYTRTPLIMRKRLTRFYPTTTTR
jgi:hypothetical protein